MCLLRPGAVLTAFVLAAGCGGRTPLDLGQEPPVDGGTPPSPDGGMDPSDGGGPPGLLECDTVGPEAFDEVGGVTGFVPTLARDDSGPLLVLTTADEVGTPELASLRLDDDGRAAADELLVIGEGLGGRVVALPGRGVERFLVAHRNLGTDLSLAFLGGAGEPVRRAAGVVENVSGIRPALAAATGDATSALALATVTGPAPGDVRAAFFPRDASTVSPQLTEGGSAASLAPLPLDGDRFALGTVFNREVRFKTLTRTRRGTVEVDTSDTIVFDDGEAPLVVQVVPVSDPDAARVWATVVPEGSGSSTRLTVARGVFEAGVSLPDSAPTGLEAAPDTEGAFVAAVVTTFAPDAGEVRGRLFVLGPEGRAFQAPIFREPVGGITGPFPAVVGLGRGRFLVVFEVSPGGPPTTPDLQRLIVDCAG